MSSDETSFVCPDCKGKGQKYLHLNPGGWKWVVCWRCQGRKTVDAETMERIEAGRELNQYMRANALGWENECLKPYGCDGVALGMALMGRVPLERIADVRTMVDRLIQDRKAADAGG